LLGGEDAFLDGLPVSVRDAAWKILAERCREVDLFLPPSRYFAELMSRRLALRPGQVRVVPNGINLTGYVPAPIAGPPVLGYFARMCREKGLDTLVDAFLLIKQRETGRSLRLHVGGGCGPGDESFVAEQRRKLSVAGMVEEVNFFPNVDHAGKIAFFRGVSIFSVPALYGEAFGLYVLEAMAAGVPVVQPRHAAFPELIEATGGGVLCEPGSAKSLADAIESLLRDPTRARDLGARGRKAVSSLFDVDYIAESFTQALKQATGDRGG
jgi:glycosyltransferase involved in cell wall biosynthesis